MNHYKNKKVIITGGLGFIGSTLASKLVANGAVVTLVDSLIPEYGGNEFNIQNIRDSVILNVCDIRDRFAMEHLIKGQDFLFNLAGQTSHIDSMKDPYTDLAINATAQLSILEACKNKNPNIKIVFASTRQIYGRPRYLPVDELHPILPVDVNGINKLAGESYHLLYNSVYGIRACVLRLTNIYGPNMRIRDARQTFIGVWIRNLIDGIPIKVYGDGSQRRDFCYVDDCVDAMMIAGLSDITNGKIYNLGGTEIITLKDIAQMMLNIGSKLNLPGVFECVEFPIERKLIDIGDYYSDNSLIKTEIGWEPLVSFDQGIEKTLKFYIKNFNNYI